MTAAGRSPPLLAVPDNPPTWQAIALSRRNGEWVKLMRPYCKTSIRQPRSPRERGVRGFSVLELMIVVVLFLIVAGITFMALQPALKDARANQAFDRVLMQLRVARQRAIAERKQYIVCFGNSAPAGALTPLGAPTVKSVQMFRWDAGTALSAAVQISGRRRPPEHPGHRAGWIRKRGHSLRL